MTTDPLFELSAVPAAVLEADGRTRAANAALRALLDEVGADALALGDPAPARMALGGRTFDVRAATLPDGARLVQLVDVTASLEAVSRLEDIIDNSAALIYVKDQAGRYRLVNDHFVARFGITREMAIGRTDDELFPREAAEIYRRHDAQVLESGTAIEEPATDVLDGSWLSIKFPIADHTGRRYAVGGISTDITDRKRAEAAAREARDEAQRANTAKSEFLSRMSHELRTPLNAILGFGQLLAFEHLEPSARESAERIVRAGDHLLALINEVLDITRIEAGGQQIEVTPVHVCEPLSEAIELVRPLAVERDVQLVVDLHGGLHRYVSADAQRLKQILLNLLSNAVKYNRRGGVVRVFLHETDPGQLRVLVVDTGPGLDRSDAERAFLPFERLNADRTQTEGSGLGLALSKALAEAMAGRIGIEHSAPGEGSTFFVELPLTAAPGGIDARRAPSLLKARDWDLGAPKILYVEDNLGNLALVESIFDRVASVELIPAMQGHIGLELATRHQPDLILLDLHLPDADGADVLRRLKADARTAGIPVIALSADATPAQMLRLEEAGTFAYLTKPLHIERFLDTVAAALGRGG